VKDAIGTHSEAGLAFIREASKRGGERVYSFAICAPSLHRRFNRQHRMRLHLNRAFFILVGKGEKAFL